jgi:hypothetical protein
MVPALHAFKIVSILTTGSLSHPVQITIIVYFPIVPIRSLHVQKLRLKEPRYFTVTQAPNQNAVQQQILQSETVST